MNQPDINRPWFLIPVIVLSQFAGTSLWFAGNAVMADLQKNIAAGPGFLGHITAAVQLGFITGTLFFALFTIADRYPPSKVFFASSILAAIANLTLIFFGNSLLILLLLRFVTGFFLAGIYPVGMKIAADWYEKNLGKALGYLVGALVLGTAFPHLLKGSSLFSSWKMILMLVSGFAVLGGVLIVTLVPEGPFRKKSTRFQPGAIIKVFKENNFRAAAFGYFGHMWELYTFWAFVPLLLQWHQENKFISYNTSGWSFAIIAMGGLSCVAGGYLAQNWGSGRVAFYSLLVSGICCSGYWLLFESASWIFLLMMLLWGSSVVSDSPQFSALIAQNAPADLKGSALTIVNCLGFSLTIVSIQCVNLLITFMGEKEKAFIYLAIGPAAGLIALRKIIK